MKAAEAPRNIQRHGPARTPHARQANVGGDARNVRIQRNDELPRRHSSPHTAIDSIFRPRHPPQIKIEALARASFRWAREQKSNADSPLQFPSRIELLVTEAEKNFAETVERASDIGIVG